MPISSPAIWGMLADWANNDVWDIINAGAPTSGGAGTGNGLCGPGSRCIDITNKIWYINTNTKASPTWLAIGGPTQGAITSTGVIKSSSPTAGIGYATGAGGVVTQITSRTTGVTLNTVSGAITLFSAAGSATPASFTVTNSAVAATDTIVVNQKSGTDKYHILITAVAAGSFQITFFTTGGTTAEQPVFNFNVIKGVAA